MKNNKKITNLNKKINNKKMICQKKAIKNYTPKEVIDLKKDKAFNHFTEEDLMAFYHQFKGISKGKSNLTKIQFTEMLHTFNLFPNEKVADRIFRIVDFDNNKKISFNEFMKYIFLLLDGSKYKKSQFIFEMICSKNKDFFEFEDLLNFYLVVNEDDDNFDASFKNDFLEEEDMTRIVFGMMKKNISEKIHLDFFRDFISQDEKHVNLFNFLRGDADSSRKDIRMKKNFLVLINIIDSLFGDIEQLEDVVIKDGVVGTDKKVKVNDNFKFKKTSNRFSTVFNKIVADFDRVKKKSTTNFKTKKNRSKFFNENFPQDENDNVNFYESEKEIKIKKANPTYSWKTRNLNTTENKISKILKGIKTKVEKVKKGLIKEIDFISKKENLNAALKNLTKNKNPTKNKSKKTDNKKVVFLNNPNWNIVTTMISGIYKSINIIENDKYHIINKSDFKIRNKIELHPIYSNLFKKCKFKDYAPHVFENIRRQFGINTDSYLRSIGINTFKNAFFEKLFVMLSENSSGKSGSFFFHSSDGKYMIKTIKKTEFQTLLNILPEYHKYVQENPNTFLTRYFGLHRMKCYKRKHKVIYDIYICVMNNIFDLKKPELIKNVYDLKGSTFKRITKFKDIEKGFAKKDLNFVKEGVLLKLKEADKRIVLQQILKDSDFLALKNVIDYSLLVGVVKLKDDHHHHFDALLFSKDSKDTQDEEVFQGKGFFEKDFDGSKFLDSLDGQFRFYVGIIDTLTQFGVFKKTEFVAKRVFQGKGISCIPPRKYQQRFCKFMEDIF